MITAVRAFTLVLQIVEFISITTPRFHLGQCGYMSSRAERSASSINAAKRGNVAKPAASAVVSGAAAEG